MSGFSPSQNASLVQKNAHGSLRDCSRLQSNLLSQQTKQILLVQAAECPGVLLQDPQRQYSHYCRVILLHRCIPPSEVSVLSPIVFARISRSEASLP